MFTVLLTVVYRSRALYPIYTYVLLNGAYAGAVHHRQQHGEHAQQVYVRQGLHQQLGAEHQDVYKRQVQGLRPWPRAAARGILLCSQSAGGG